jgi:eukaryotic-like serine/threonine-protein kinase
MNVLTRWLSAQPPAQPERGDALAAGRVLGGVTLERTIGHGSSAAVYAGAEADSATPRAVKVWAPPGGADDAAQRARFLDEAQRIQALDHPGIVRVYRSGTQDGLSYIVCELFPGGSLARYAGPEHRLPEPLVLDIAAQLAQALDYAHRQGVVHRDVKPSNALFDLATRRAALSDFGVARGLDAQASRSGVLVGSPVYMAPELLAGQSASASSDLYALAVLSFELLAGRAPFAAGSMGALLRAVAQAAPPPLATLRPDWPEAVAARLDRWVAPLLAKNPAQRPADGAAWAALARAAARELWPEASPG